MKSLIVQERSSEATDRFLSFKDQTLDCCVFKHLTALLFKSLYIPNEHRRGDSVTQTLVLNEKRFTLSIPLQHLPAGSPRSIY